MKLRQSKRADFLVDITPLVDVVFLMLIFFMVSTSFNVAASLKLELPSSHATAQQQDIKQITISIDEKGNYFVQDEAVSEEDLRSRILNYSKGDPNIPVVLRADANARHGKVVFVLDTLRGLGLAKVGIATIPEGEE